jgi:cysteine sulfinate desulfinase/cysteine desulfurase-like protein
MVDANEKMVALRDALHLRIAEALHGVVLNGHPLDRLPNTLNLSFLGVRASDVVERTPDLVLATGPACHDRSSAPSPTFEAMGLGADRASSSLRISLGRSTTLEDVERAGDALIEAVEHLRRAAGSLPAEAHKPSLHPLCPRCETPLKLERIQTIPAVVCRRHPTCRYEVPLALPASV